MEAFDSGLFTRADGYNLSSDKSLIQHVLELARVFVRSVSNGNAYVGESDRPSTPLKSPASLLGFSEREGRGQQASLKSKEENIKRGVRCATS